MAGRSVERVFPGAPPLRPGASLVPASFQYVLTGNEFLRIRMLSVVGGEACKASWRTWRADTQDVHVTEETFSGYGASSPDFRDYPLTTGVLLNFRIEATKATLDLGELWTEVHLVEGSGNAARIIGTLTQGYLGGRVALGWPGTPLQSLHDGKGSVFGDTFSFVATTVETYTVAAIHRLRPICGTFDFVASAVVADRFAFVRVTKPGGLVVFEATNGVAMPASTTWRISYGAGLAPSGVAALNVSVLPLPGDLELDPGDGLTVYIGNTQAGDLLSSQDALFRAWLIG